MKTEIYINEQLIELFDDEPIVLSYSVNNLFEIESRQGNYSNTFRVPATKKNNRIFEFTNNVLTTSTIQYERLPCQIFVDSILVIDGTAQIVSTSPLEYEINIIGGASTWYDIIKNISLRDVLDDCEHSFKWNQSEVISNRLNTWIDGKVYPNIDYGELFFSTPTLPNMVYWLQLYPAVYVKYLFKKCLEFAGIQYESEFIDNDPLFEKQIIPFSAEWKRTKNYSLRNYFNAEFTSDFNPVPPNVFTNWKFIFPIIKYPCYDFLNSETWISTTPDPYASLYDAPGNSYYCILDYAKIKFEYEITVDLISIGAGATQKLTLYYWDKNGVMQTVPIIDQNIQLYAGLYTVNGTIEIEPFRGAIYFGAYQGNGVSSYPLTIKAGSYFNMVEYIPIETDENVYNIDVFYNWGTLGGSLPNITVADFMLTIANQYGLIFEQKPQSTTLKIYQFKDVIQNINNAVDWSKKLDLSEEYNISFISDEYSRNNYFKYSEDSEDEYLMRQPELGQGSIVFDSAPENTEQTLFESVFSPTVRVDSYSGTVPLAWIPIYETNQFTLVNPRMCYIDFDTSAILTILPSGYTPPNQPNVYFTELDFKSLLPKYYPQYSNILNKNKVVSVLLRLNNLDIAKLDFKRPIWIDYFNAYFYINEISQYNIVENDSTRVELILL